MKTEILEVVAGPAGERAIERAAAILRSGGLVAFPTETVYGLGALALDPEAVERIFLAKGRPSFNPLIAHVFDEDRARELVADWPLPAAALADAFWPGPLTLVLPKAAHVPDVLTAGLPSVAIRAPAHPVANALLRAVGAPIAAPSANRYMAVSPTTAAHVAKGLAGRIDAIVDGGATPLGIESTVVDLGGGSPTLLRPGAISLDELEAVIGRVERRGGAVEEGVARTSPGQGGRHYAPDAKVVLAEGEELPREVASAQGPVGVLARRPRPAGVGTVTWLQLPDDAPAYARQLYAALHALEDAGTRTIVIEEVPPHPVWDGVRDRLLRAGG